MHQKHIIKRQVIELQIPAGLDRVNIQNSVAKTFYDRLLPLIDKYLTKESLPNSIDKIDILELDLGNVSINNLDRLLAEKFEAELKIKLPHFNDAQKSSAQKKSSLASISHSDLDLIVYFLQSGSFPWWAKETSARVLQNAFANLFKKDVSQLKKIFNPLLSDEAVLKRLCYTCDNESLSSLAEIYLPGKSDAIQQLLAEIISNNKRKLSRDFINQGLWYFVLDMSVNEKAGSTGYDDSISEMLTNAISKNSSSPNFTGEIKYGKEALLLLNQIFNITEKVRGERFLKKSDEVFSEIEKSILKITSHGLVTKDIFEDEIGILVRCTKDLKKVLSGEAMIIYSQDEIEKIDKAAAQIQTLLSDDKAVFLNPSEIEKIKQYIQQISASASILKKQITKYKPQHRDDQKTGKFDKKELYDQFSRTDKLYIQNAGLVLLWPFINRFFINLEIADEKEFLNEFAQEKACLILQYLIEGSTEDIFEALLPLNKVLCGIELQQPVNTQLLLTAEEAEASENFLNAVIANAPLWKNLSVENFRQAYLRREGVLSTRDGNWLLQVKRETYDILIDKLPWTVQVVKLPWMKNLIFVEW